MRSASFLQRAPRAYWQNTSTKIGLDPVQLTTPIAFVAALWLITASALKYSLNSPSFGEPSLLCCALMRPNEPQAMTVIIQPRPKRSVSMPKRGDQNVLVSGMIT